LPAAAPSRTGHRRAEAAHSGRTSWRQIVCCKDFQHSRRAAATGALQQPELSELPPQPCRQATPRRTDHRGLGPPTAAGRADDTGPGSCPITPKQSRLAIFFYLDPGTPSRTARGDFGATVGFESYLATRSRSGERPPSARRRRPLAEAQDRSPAQQKIRFSPTPAALRLSVLSLLAHEPWAARPRVPSLLIQVGLASLSERFMNPYAGLVCPVSPAVAGNCCRPAFALLLSPVSCAWNRGISTT